MSKPVLFINESQARVVAAQVALLAVGAVVFRQPVVVAVLAADFAARLAAGLAISPLARIAHHVVVPALGLPERRVPVAPKRFAQVLGLVMTGGASAAWFVTGISAIALAAAGLLVVLAGLEAALGLCVACVMYNGLVRAGIVRAPQCEACQDIQARRSASP